LAVINVIEKNNLLAHATKIGEQLREGLEALMDTYPQILEVRGRGLLVGMVVKVLRRKSWMNAAWVVCFAALLANTWCVSSPR
jgi:4-aminobutyrate aminotransferase-like enzyme